MPSYYYVVTRYDVMHAIAAYVFNIVNHFDLIELFINKV